MVVKLRLQCGKKKAFLTFSKSYLSLQCELNYDACQKTGLGA